jgi:type III secretory pathway component EscU
MHNFDRDFQRMGRRHDTMFKVVTSFIGVIWVLVIVGFIAAGVLVFNVSGQ